MTGDIDCAGSTASIHEPERFLMAQEHSDITLADVKRLLDQFAASRADKPRQDVEAEYGDLLLYLIFLAGRSGVDLLAGANRELDRVAVETPVLVDRYR
jgi:hypothetical protein